MRTVMTFTQAANILKVDPAQITKEELKKTYVALARQNHPDYCKLPNANEVMGQINEAYSTLKNEVPIKGYKPERQFDKNFNFTGAKPPEPSPTYSSTDLSDMLRRMFQERFQGFDFEHHEGFNFSGIDPNMSRGNQDPNMSRGQPSHRLYKGVNPFTGEPRMFSSFEEAELSKQQFYDRNSSARYNQAEQEFTWIDPQTGETRHAKGSFDEKSRTYAPSPEKNEKIQKEFDKAHTEWLKRERAKQSKYNVPPPKQEQVGKWKRSAKGNLYRVAPDKPNLHRWIIIPDNYASATFKVLERLEDDGMNMTINHDKTFTTEESAILYVDELIARIHHL